MDEEVRVHRLSAGDFLGILCQVQLQVGIRTRGALIIIMIFVSNNDNNNNNSNNWVFGRYYRMIHRDHRGILLVILPTPVVLGGLVSGF